MKQAAFSIFIALMAIVSFTGCKKENNTLGTMTAKVYSDDFVASTCSAVHTGGWYIIRGNDAHKQSFVMFIKSDALQLTTYNFENNYQTHHAAYYDGAEDHPAITGGATITAFNAGKNITGTFAFRNPDGTIITDGRFTAVF